MAINLGNIASGVGISSNLDTKSLIEGLKASRQSKITRVTDSIALNSGKSAAYGDLRSILTKLSDAAGYLRNPPGVSAIAAAGNIFQYRSASITSPSISSPSSYISVAAAPGATVGSHEITIGSIAKSIQQRSAAFLSRSDTATDNSLTNYINAGTFSVGSGIVENVTGDTKTGFALSSGDYSVAGSGAGIATGGITNFTVVGGSGGDEKLKGSISGFSGSYNSGDSTVTLTISINGRTYTSNAVTANSVIGGDTGISSGTAITFTGDSGGVNETSFQISLTSDVVINGDASGEVNTLETNLDAAIAGQNILQARQLQNVQTANIKSPLTNLTQSHVVFNSDSYNLTTGEIGEIGGFSVVHSTGSNGSISVLINGETFTASGLSTSLTGNLVLESTTTDRSIEINIADAGVAAIDLSSESAGVALERALDYTFGTRTLTDITVNSGDSLNDVVFAINQKTNDTGLSASIIQVGDFDYRLSIQAVNTGIDGKYEIFDSSNVLTNANITTTQAAQNAEFTLDGISLERSSNTIADVIPNVTFNLIAATGSDEINVDISRDLTTVTNQVISFIDAYNEFRVFYTKMNERDPETSGYTEEAILGGDSLLDTLSNTLSSFATKIVEGVSDANFDSIQDVGITFSNFIGDDTTPATENILVYDPDTLAEALANNFDKVREIFEYSFTSSSNNLQIYSRENSHSINEFKLAINTSAAAGYKVQLMNTDGSAYLDDEGDPVYLDYANGLISGRDGTDVEGLEFVYTGDGTDTISVSFTQGVGDLFYNIANQYTKDDGNLDDQIEILSDSNDDKETEVSALQAQLDDYVSRMEARFAALERAISSINSIIQYLVSNENASNARN
jgi:flagellar hook-associated protein 2